MQQAFRLSGLIPSAEVLSADVVQIQPLLREACEQLAGAKDSWLKAAAGRAENLPKLKQTLASVHTKAVEVKQGALMKLTAALVENLDKMPASGVSEPVAMEFATALLLAESAFDNYASLSHDFPRQVTAMLARLDAARAGRATVASAPMLDEMSKRAQERVLLAQVGREIRANLRHMEQVLDAFFRDNGKRAELAALTKDGQQIRGALQMLGQYDADRLLAMCQEQIERYATTEEAIGNDDLDLLAESLSGLGFFIEAFEQQRPDRDRLIAPLIARRLGEAPAPVVVETESVEDAVAALRAELPTLVAEVQSAPADGTAGEELKVKLAGLRDDAELIGDADLVAQADAALKAMASGGAAGLAAVVDVIADGGVADAPEISAETQRLLATDTSTLDAELLDIYLTEAAEVLDTVVEHHRILTLNPGDREALATVRRQFHTLKGSGRMVGLADLGELAWEVEQVHNRLIEEDRTVSPSVLAMIDVAQASFRGWVGELRATNHVAPDPNALLAAIHAVQREWPGGAKLPPPAPVLTRVAKVGTAANATAANEPAAAGTSAAADATPLPPPIASEPAAPVPVEEPFGIALDPASLMDIVVPIEAESGDAQSVDMESIDVESVDAESVDAESVDAESVDAESVDAQSFDTESTGTDVRTDVILPSAETPPVVFEIDVSAPSPVEIVELAELGAAPADEAPHVVTDEAAPDEESIDIALPPDDAAHAPLLRLVADNTFVAAEPRELPPPAIAASAAAPDSGDAPGYEEPAEGGDVTIGDVTLSASLWAILCDEAEQRVGTLQHELSLLQFDARQAPSEAMVRASHTLCGIHRTGGFPPIARTSKALEQALIALQQRGAPLPTSAQAVLAGAIDHLAQCVTRVRDRIAFTGDDLARADAVTRELEALRRDVMGAAAVDAETAAAEAADRDERQPEVAAEIPVDAAVDPLPTPEMPQDVAAPELVAFVEAPSESALPEPARDDLAPEPAPYDLAPEPAPEPAPTSRPSPRHDLAPEPVPEPEPIAAATPIAAPEPDLRLPAPLVDPLADIRDDVDTQVLAIFLEEASELYPQAGEQVRGWRRNPRDGVVVQHLRRTLHTFKGSARMAGAMRLGELAHLMESRLMNGDSPVPPTDELFDALDGDLDDVAFVLDALRDGKTNVDAPALRRAAARDCADRPARCPTSRRTRAGGRGRIADAASASTASDLAEVESAAKAMLRVRADVIDRLVNESGEVPIARSRVEGELRALKANLLELTASVIRLRSQVREIEMQAETQIQSRMSAAQTVHQDFDPLELDRFTRFQELTRSLAEGVNDVSTVQQSLLQATSTTPTRRCSRRRACRAKSSSGCSRFARCLSAACRSACTESCAPPHASSTSAPTSKSTAARPSSIARCWRSSSDRSNTCCATRSTTASSRVTRAWRPARRKPARSRSPCGRSATKSLIELADDGGGIDFTRRSPSVRSRSA